jgi:hypothetical protein
MSFMGSTLINKSFLGEVGYYLCVAFASAHDRNSTPRAFVLYSLSMAPRRQKKPVEALNTNQTVEFSLSTEDTIQCEVPIDPRLLTQPESLPESLPEPLPESLPESLPELSIQPTTHSQPSTEDQLDRIE